MKKLLFLFSILCSMALQAKVADHFKKVEGKNPSLNRMRNIDFIYMINLDKRPEKFQKSVDQLKPYGIHPYRFSAVCGWDLTLETINDLGVKLEPWMDSGFRGTSYLTPDFKPHHSIINKNGQTYFVHCFSRGSMGIILSHLSILQDAYDSGYETIWVMEDDINVIRDPRIIPDMIDKLDVAVGKGNWDILFTDRDFVNKSGNYVQCTSYGRRPNFKPLNGSRFLQKTILNSDFRKIGARFGATSMIVRRSGMKKILDFIKAYQVFLPYDLEFSAPNDIQLYTVINDIVGNLPNAASNNSRPPKTI